MRGPNEAICPRDGAYLGQGYTSACGEAQVPRMRKKGTRKCLRRPVGYNMRNASRRAFSSKVIKHVHFRFINPGVVELRFS